MYQGGSLLLAKALNLRDTESSTSCSLPCLLASQNTFHRRRFSEKLFLLEKPAREMYMARRTFDLVGIVCWLLTACGDGDI